MLFHRPCSVATTFDGKEITTRVQRDPGVAGMGVVTVDVTFPKEGDEQQMTEQTRLPPSLMHPSVTASNVVANHGGDVFAVWTTVGVLIMQCGKPSDAHVYVLTGVLLVSNCNARQSCQPGDR
jgi:hypothetical protein